MCVSGDTALIQQSLTVAREMISLSIKAHLSSNKPIKNYSAANGDITQSLFFHAVASIFLLPFHFVLLSVSVSPRDITKIRVMTGVLYITWVEFKLIWRSYVCEKICISLQKKKKGCFPSLFHLYAVFPFFLTLLPFSTSRKALRFSPSLPFSFIVKHYVPSYKLS